MPAEALLNSFETGDPQTVYEAAQALVKSYLDLGVYAAKLRFALNFGTELCQNCDGLRAGPGVLATCHQVEQCNFTNIKENEQTPRLLRVLQTIKSP